MSELATIIRPILPELQRFEEGFLALLSSEVAPLDTILSYVAEVRGKRLRPSLVLLSARLFGSPSEATFRTSWFVELIHTATLIHDDVVDGTAARRGRAAVHVHWDTPKAVLAGDYLLGKAMQLLANANDLPILNEMLNTTAAMSEGELMQQRRMENVKRIVEDKTWDGTLSQDEYREVITRKTALLFRSCCVGGALSVKAPAEAVECLADFGLHLGRVFQLRDDQLDNDDPTAAQWAGQMIDEELAQALEALKAVETLLKTGSPRHPEGSSAGAPVIPSDTVETAAEWRETLDILHALAVFSAERLH